MMSACRMPSSMSVEKLRFTLLHREPPAEAELPTVLSGHAAGGPRHDRRARAARFDQSSSATTPDDQPATIGRRAARAATDQNHCGEVTSPSAGFSHKRRQVFI